MKQKIKIYWIYTTRVGTGAGPPSLRPFPWGRKVPPKKVSGRPTPTFSTTKQAVTIRKDQAVSLGSAHAYFLDGKSKMCRAERG